MSLQASAPLLYPEDDAGESTLLGCTQECSKEDFKIDTDTDIGKDVDAHCCSPLLPVIVFESMSST